MTLPNFLIVGAAKSGSTALHYYLKRHPQVYMCPPKETNFFAFEGREANFRGPGDSEFNEATLTTLEEYEKQFEAVSNEVAIGEASPWYLYSSRAAANIYRHAPEAKIIAVLRDPVDRAFSSYLHVVRDGRESLTFEEGLQAEEDRVAQGWEYIWHYRRAGLYVAQIERFWQLFPREQVRIYIYDDFVMDPTRFLQDIYEFLEIETAFKADISLRHNVTGVPRNRLLGRLLVRPNRLRSTAKLLIPKRLRHDLGQKINQSLIKKPTLDGETRSKLVSSYKEEILALQDLIGRDLSAWIDGSSR
jgi:hypothetical protein